ncbi:MAG: hypothetical protein AAF621_03465 [Pseudomonadota bacterium]
MSVSIEKEEIPKEAVIIHKAHPKRFKRSRSQASYIMNEEGLDQDHVDSGVLAIGSEIAEITIETVIVLSANLMNASVAAQSKPYITAVGAALDTAQTYRFH